MPPCHHNTPHSRYHNRQHTPTVNCWMIILNQSLGKTAQLSVCCRCQHNYKTSRYEEIESIMMTSRYDEGDGESKKILPRAISHAELSRRQLVVAPGGRVGRRSAGRSPGGGAGARVRGGHRVGSLPRWNSLNVASLHHLWKQEINSFLFFHHLLQLRSHLQAVDESRQANSERWLAVLIALLSPSLLFLAVTVWSWRRIIIEICGWISFHPVNSPEPVGLGGTQLRSFLNEPPPHLQWQASITKLYPCCFHKFCNFCFSDQLRSFFCPSLVLFK